MSLKSIAFTIIEKEKILILLELFDGRLAAYSDDKIINIYKRSTKIAFSIKSINSIIKWMIQTKDQKLICCSYEITIFKLYKDHFETLQIIKNSWTNKIFEIKEFDNNSNLVASQNNYIRIYEISKKSNLYKLKETIRFNENVNNFIYLKNDDYALILDDYFKNIYINIYNLKLHNNKVNLYQIKAKDSGDMCILQNKYLVVSVYLNLILIDIEEEYKVIQVIKTIFGCVNSFCYFKNYTFFSGDDVGDITEWQIIDNKLKKIKDYNNCKEDVNSIIKYNNNSWIAAGSNDGLIKFYETDF